MFQPLARALAARGVRFESILAELGVNPPGAMSSDARLPLLELEGFWDRVFTLTGDRYFGLGAAEHVDLATGGVVSYLAVSAETLGEALRKQLEYQSLVTDAFSWALDVGRDATLSLRTRATTRAPAQAVEYRLAAQQVFLQRFGPSGCRLRSVSFRHAAPSDLTPFEDVFQVKPRFGAALDRLCFDASLLDAPMPGRDDALAELLERHARQALQELSVERSFSERVRELLGSGVGPGMAWTAGKLGVSTRALQRALTIEGTSYSELAGAARRAAAERLLERTDLGIAEIAHELGFCDVSAFHRAFVRWTRTTPGAFRARSRGAHPWQVPRPLAASVQPGRATGRDRGLAPKDKKPARSNNASVRH